MAARALGGSPARLIARHVLPNVMPIIVVMAVLGTSGTLLLDAGLSFLGLGVPPPTPSWGRMIEEATIYFRTAPWLVAFPGLAIFYAVLAFNLLGYGYLRAAAGGPGDEAAARARAAASSPDAAAPAKPARRIAWPASRATRLPVAGCSPRRQQIAQQPRRAPRARGCCAMARRGIRRRRRRRRMPRGGRAGDAGLSARREGAASRRAGRRADARPGGRLRHRLVDLRADDLRHAGALQRRRRRPGAGDGDELGESPDARVFTFHLRRDARFTNGRAVTAADFKYEIERVLDPATRSKGMEYFREITGRGGISGGACARGRRNRDA